MSLFLGPEYFLPSCVTLWLLITSFHWILLLILEFYNEIRVIRWSLLYFIHLFAWECWMTVYKGVRPVNVVYLQLGFDCWRPNLFWELPNIKCVIIFQVWKLYIVMIGINNESIGLKKIDLMCFLPLVLIFIFFL
jgi:hypothetical protein